MLIWGRETTVKIGTNNKIIKTWVYILANKYQQSAIIGQSLYKVKGKDVF